MAEHTLLPEEKQKLSGFQLFLVAALFFLAATEFIRPIVSKLDNISYYYRLFGTLIALDAGLLLSRAKREWRPWLIPSVTFFAWLIVCTIVGGSGAGLKKCFSDGIFTRWIFLGFVCWPTGCMLEKGQRRTFVQVLLALWVAAEAILCATGLVALFTNQKFYNFSHKMYLGMSSYGRFTLFYYPTTASNEMYSAALGAILGLIMTRRKGVKVLYGLAAVVLYAGTSLSLGRAALLCFGAGVGLMIGFAVIRKIAKPVFRWITVGALVIVCTLASYYGSDLFVNLYNQVIPTTGKITSIELIPSASAEEEEEEEETAAPASNAQTLGHRTSTDGDFFSGRLYIWRAAFDLLRNEPSILLIGTGRKDAMSRVKVYLDPANPIGTYNHLHNIWLQILVEYGLPGLFLFCWLQIIFLMAAWRIIRAPSAPYWQKALTAVPIAIWGNETVDAFVRLNANVISTVICFILMGVVFAIAQEYRKPEAVKA